MNRLDSQSRSPRARFRPCAAGVLAFACAPSASAQTGDFELVTLADGLVLPTALASAPDGRLFIGQKNGTILVLAPGESVARPLQDLDVYDGAEAGLLGLAIDPAFAENGHVYAFASVSLAEQRILRIDADEAAAREPVIVRDNIPGADFHGGGGIEFGPDGMLYYSVGDTTDPSLAQPLTSLAGKLARVRPDGDTPPDNPFATPTGAPSAIYALGFRNPFRFCFASDGRAFVFDVGSDGAQRREEINIVRAGDNCGWPLFEGTASGGDSDGFTDPAYEYFDEGSAITGGVFYERGQWPAEYLGDLLHVEFVLNRLYRLELDGDRAVRHSTLLELEGGPTDLVQHADGTLIYCELYTGRVRQIRYAGPLPPATAPVAGDQGAVEEPIDESGDDPAGEVADEGGGALSLPICAAPPALLLCAAFALAQTRRHLRPGAVPRRTHAPSVPASCEHPTRRVH